VNRGRPTSPLVHNNGAGQLCLWRDVMDQDTNQTPARAMGVRPEGCCITGGGGIRVEVACPPTALVGFLIMFICAIFSFVLDDKCCWTLVQSIGH
jgi:hypothetical protein